jgi:hypothetical protein
MDEAPRDEEFEEDDRRIARQVDETSSSNTSLGPPIACKPVPAIRRRVGWRETEGGRRRGVRAQ